MQSSDQSVGCRRPVHGQCRAQHQRLPVRGPSHPLAACLGACSTCWAAQWRAPGGLTRSCMHAGSSCARCRRRGWTVREPAPLAVLASRARAPADAALRQTVWQVLKGCVRRQARRVRRGHQGHGHREPHRGRRDGPHGPAPEGRRHRRLWGGLACGRRAGYACVTRTDVAHTAAPEPGMLDQRSSLRP